MDTVIKCENIVFDSKPAQTERKFWRHFANNDANIWPYGSESESDTTCVPYVLLELDAVGR